MSERDIHAGDSVGQPEDREDMMDIETPEADSAEQNAAAGAAVSDEPVHSAPIEVNEADAAEQSRIVELDEDDYR